MIRQTLRAIRRRIKGEHYHEIGPGTELPSAWYDWAYGETPAYHAHYSDSGYYFLWSVIVDRMLRAGVRQVLDLGCGPGQVAALLYDKGMREYRGLDFSQKAIEIAKSRGVPGFEFQIRDLSQGDFANIPHDCVVTLEFLEHVEFDIPLLSRIKPGTRVFATVPNFPYAGHVRWFDTVEQVAARYASLFSHFTVDAFLGNAKGKTFYLMEGVKL